MNAAERTVYRRKLIMLVQKHPILWNKKMKWSNCRKLPLKSKAWQEISLELGMKFDKIRRTWESLRDQYRRELKREVKYGFVSKWQFFNDMDFVRPMVNCKESDNEMTDSDTESEVNEQRQQQLNRTQCSHITTNLITATTPTLSSQSTSRNLQAPNSHTSILPIMLTKQRHGLKDETTSQQKNELNFSCVPPQPFQTVVYPSGCDSSNNVIKHQPFPEPLMNGIVAKQELDLEIDNSPPSYDVSEKQPSDSLTFISPNASHNAREFQEESSVSTSGHKRNRSAYEDNADTTTSYPVEKRPRKADSDLEVKDDDYYFVMSLLPSLRQISHKRNFSLRLGIMNLIAKNLEDQC